MVVAGMKACVVGCGPSGIVAAKHLKAAGLDFDVFERSESIGGTWVYSEGEKNIFGQPVHTAMYKNLRTNFPKELMEFDGLKHLTDESFLRSNEILKYLKDFAEKFDIMKYIKLGHMVQNIERKGDKWEVTVEDLEMKRTLTSTYDVIFVCNGHHFIPRYPTYQEGSSFKGLQMHSKEYRKPEEFKDMNLLIIGFGYSAQDMAIDSSKAAKKVFLSHHSTRFNPEYFPKNVVPKPDVKSIGEDTVTFKDGSVEKIDAILYCTGYRYSLPFLDSSCGISCQGDSVRPLYRHLVNINQPTMAFIGLNFNTIVFYVFEMQVKAFMKVLLGECSLPSKEKMTEELEKYEKDLKERGVPSKKYHLVGSEREQFRYIREIGDLPDFPEVIKKIYFFNYEKRRDFVHEYRKYIYKVEDDENYSVTYCENKD